MKKVINLLIVVSLMLVLLPAASFADSVVANLIAGQYTDVGDVTVWNDSDSLHVKYETDTTAGWYLVETHLHVCKETALNPCPDCIPQRNGNPPPGQFNYNVPDSFNPSVAVYEIPLADIEAGTGDTLCIAAHAVVYNCCLEQEETAWAEGEDFPGKNWAMYFPYTVQDPPISATIDIDPDTLNLKSGGKFITCYIELPAVYDVGDIDVSTILLNGTISAALDPTEIGDYDHDGIPDLMVKFDRQELIPLLEVGYVELTVTGELVDGATFEGTDTIRVK